MFYTYAIKSLNRNYIYVGLTNNINRRLKEHNKGYNKTTKPYKTFKLIYKEEFVTRKDAREKGKYLKSGSGKEFLKSIYDAGVAELVDAQDLKSCGCFTRAGSSPALGTKRCTLIKNKISLLFY